MRASFEFKKYRELYSLSCVLNICVCVFMLLIFIPMGVFYNDLLRFFNVFMSVEIAVTSFFSFLLMILSLDDMFLGQTEKKWLPAFLERTFFLRKPFFIWNMLLLAFFSFVINQKAIFINFIQGMSASYNLVLLKVFFVIVFLILSKVIPLLLLKLPTRVAIRRYVQDEVESFIRNREFAEPRYEHDIYINYGGESIDRDVHVQCLVDGFILKYSWHNLGSEEGLSELTWNSIRTRLQLLSYLRRAAHLGWWEWRGAPSRLLTKLMDQTQLRKSLLAWWNGYSAAEIERHEDELKEMLGYWSQGKESLIDILENLENFVSPINLYDQRLFLNRVSAVLECAKAKGWNDVVDRAYGTLALFYFHTLSVSEKPEQKQQCVEKALGYIEKISEQKNVSPAQALSIGQYYLFATARNPQAEIEGLKFLYVAARHEGEDGRLARTLLLDRLLLAHPSDPRLKQLQHTSTVLLETAKVYGTQPTQEFGLGGLDEDDGEERKHDASDIGVFFDVIDVYYQTRLVELSKIKVYKIPDTEKTERNTKRIFEVTHQIPLFPPKLTYCHSSRSRFSPRFNFSDHVAANVSEAKLEPTRGSFSASSSSSSSSSASTPRFNYGAVVSGGVPPKAKTDAFEMEDGGYTRLENF